MTAICVYSTPLLCNQRKRQRRPLSVSPRRDLSKCNTNPNMHKTPSNGFEGRWSCPYKAAKLISASCLQIAGLNHDGRWATFDQEPARACGNPLGLRNTRLITLYDCSSWQTGPSRYDNDIAAPFSIRVEQSQAQRVLRRLSLIDVPSQCC